MKRKPTDVVQIGALQEEKIRVNINVPLRLKREWKIVAAQHDTSVSALIVEAVEAWRAAQKKKRSD